MMREPIDKSKALSIAPKLEIDYSPKDQSLEFNGLGARPNILGYIAAGIQFLKSLHGKRGDE